MLLDLKVSTVRMLCSARVGKLIDRYFRGVIPTKGLRIATDAPGVTPQMVAALYFGFYERAEIQLLRRWLRRDLDVVELGSSLGVVASHIARHVAADRRILCVEGNPRLADAIRGNIARNAPGRTVAVVSGAVDYDRATVEFNVAARSIDSRVGSGMGAVRVPAVRLGDLVREHGISEFALVSDIEGAEVGLIEDDYEGLRRCRQMLIELHPAERRGRRLTPDDLLGMLQSRHGFQLVARRGPVCVLER